MTEPRALVVFIGAPASGKSKIAKRVAALLGVERIDTDKEIVATHGAISDIFANQGEPAFRALERAAVKRALAESAVVSLGGGAVLDPDTQSDLLRSHVVLLTVSEEAVAERIGGDKRPLLSGGVESWKRLVAARTPIYEKLADVSWDTSSGDLDGIAEEVSRWINAGYPAGEK
ncbi:shikimate kinase [Aurantimicrobium minutum]|uniref:shikimate kinase n=1 Tax=Aurantimicrobium minutum TaxID=708131 RepID=UPI0024771E98|nr:shikimate kinase [Aurantimicrobium minutum]MDH6532997.1 shikimate kinase [Aurantimicrobium minutum]